MSNKDAVATSKTTLYRQIRREILNCLESGEWKPGDRLPNEPSLARRWGVGISTLRAGIGQLVETGILTRRQGRGTFVAPLGSYDSSLRFSNIQDDGCRPVRTERDVVSLRTEKGDRAVRQALRLDDDAGPVRHAAGILRDRGEAIATLDLFLPSEPFRSLTRHDLRQRDRNLYAIYQACCGITVLRMEERIHARAATDPVAATLGIEPGAPVLLVERVAFTFNDTPVELRRRCFRASGYHYLFRQDKID